MLSKKTGAYAYAGLPAGADAQSVYFPDAVVAPFAAEAAGIKPAGGLGDLGDAATRRFSLAESKALVIEAMTAFDPRLGQKAAEILKTAHYSGGDADLQVEAEYRALAYDDSYPHDGGDNPYLAADHKLNVPEGARWDIRPVPAGQCQLMRCLPAESPQQEYDMGGAGKFYDPANPHKQAVIEYQFDGTIDAVVHMAHEMGHAIADDYQREAGHSYRDNPQHMQETQAYLTQHILYDHLRRHPDRTIAQAVDQHFTVTMAGSLRDMSDNERLHVRPMGLLTALGIVDHLKEQDLRTKQRTSETLLGRQGPKGINEVLATAGIERAGDMEKLARTAIRHATEPLQAHHAMPAPAAKQFLLTGG